MTYGNSNFFKLEWQKLEKFENQTLKFEYESGKA
jgi:hypothetical protein